MYMQRKFIFAALAAAAVVGGAFVGWLYFQRPGSNPAAGGGLPQERPSFSGYRFSLQLPAGYRLQRLEGPRARPMFAALGNSSGETVTLRIHYDEVDRTSDALVESYRGLVNSEIRLRGKTPRAISRHGTLPELLLMGFPPSATLAAATEVSRLHCSVFTLTFQTGKDRLQQQVAVFPTAVQDYQGEIVFQYPLKRAREMAAVVESIACAPPSSSVAPSGEAR